MAGAIKSGKNGWRFPEKEEFNYSKESKTFLKIYKKFVTTNYGKRCEAKCNGCLNCEMWSLYDLTETMLA